uniref:CD276 antigen homolog n=1 Tax=Pristiophorus japonicus TaxID=55135 RepID=UPI00398F101B
MRLKSQFHILVLWGQLIVGQGFEVRMIKGPVTAIHGQIAVLGCSFTVTRGPTVENLIVTWQRVETDEVVHSYYYGEDQLSKQHPQYSGRTSLFPQEFQNGNASLKLEAVRPEDTGLYQCYVSTTIGHEKGVVSVKFAAYYNEPMLLINQKLSSTILTFESRGYPKADVSWYNGDNLDNSLLSKSSHQQTADSLYTVQSSIEINVTERRSNYTFVLRNAAVNQTTSRTLSFLIPENSIWNQELSCNYYTALTSWILVTILIIIIIITIIVLAVVLHKHRYIKPMKIEYIKSGLP